MSVVIFIIVLFVLVLVHEWGHFIVAKKTGMRVDEFGIGFPPKLFSRKRGETEYSVNALPLGGFVRIFGEDLDQKKEDTTGDKQRSFTAKSKWAQSAVLLAGVTMNIIFAWFLFMVAFTSGVQSAVDEADAGPDARLIITEVVPGGPADESLLPRGAIIESLESGTDRRSDLTPSSFSAFIAAHPNEDVRVTYLLRDESVVTVLTPRTGIIAGEPERAAVGIALTMIEELERPIHVAAYDALIHTAVSIRDITIGLSGLVKDALMMNADLTQVAGPVGIVGLVGEASAFGFSALLLFTAFISLNLAVINLLPFPALDGGRLLFVAIEAVKGSPINPRIATALNSFGFALLILLMLAVTWNDVTRLI